MPLNALRFVAAKWPIVALLVFVNLSVLALIWVSLDNSRRQYQDRAEITSRNTNRLVAQSIAGDIDRIDLALLTTIDEIGRLRQTSPMLVPGTLTPFLTRLQGRLPMADSVRLAGPDGAVIDGSGGVPAGITVADREYFAKLRDKAATGLVISQPILGRVSNKWVLIFARRVDLADGGFGGIVFASVTIDWFEQKFNGLEVGVGGTVVMRGDASRDFDLLARVPHAGYVGQTKVSETFRARITAKPEGDTYQAAAGADGIHRTFSYRPIANYPLITLVGLATEDYVGEWRKEATKLAGLAGAFLLVTVLSGIGLLRTWRTLERRTEELARSNADLEQFAYVASHDLQSPLRNISGYAQLLARRYKGRLDEDADEFIDYIVSGAQHMSAMIPDLLNYARASTAPQVLSEVKLDEILQSVQTNLGSTIAAAGAEITVGPLPSVRAEPRQVESLFQNLIENALTYRTPDRSVRISVTAEPGPTGMWRFAVADNGIGIESQYFDKIFGVFQRLEPNRFPGGTGIGLALCRRIVTRFGGTIWVESKPDIGTTFFFTLQDAKVEDQKD
ncbi:Signal transduction histidine kinase [Magnetospirillum sp. LM-5]|uniref:sensor histidine kinase n=1 Tax=Magnetospirillum sp. LM-5 TaxID=2681466 RepID=UPI0013847F19|nr:sensor histidine kinase [Magnetospirillum sp. LM-5]CAA7616411.1 Signal transduction histidine kinase [Magnetospirillum sp. LM-5]